MSKFLTITKAAKEFGINRQTLYSWILSGKVKAEKRQNAPFENSEFYVVDRESLESLLATGIPRGSQRKLNLNPERANMYRMNGQRHRAKKKKVKATFSTDDWLYCVKYFDYTCAVCGRPVGFWHTLAQDHWIPISKGGAYTRDNIIPLCHGDGGCNNEKHDRTALAWLIDKYGSRKAQQITDKVQAYFDHLKGRTK